MKTEWDRELVIRYRTAGKSAKVIEQQIRETLEEYASMRGNEAVFDDFALTYFGEGQLVVIDDYRKVIWQTNGGNIEFTFSEQQRKIVKLLHVYWRAGQISVRGRKLMEEAIGDIGSENSPTFSKAMESRTPLTVREA
ncbi:MAG: hypothetical protein IPH10_08600 [bacterium]|nr:hypothetical protein [bacterium]